MHHTDEQIADIIEDGECSEELHEALTVEAENIVYNVNFEYLCKHGKK